MWADTDWVWVRFAGYCVCPQATQWMWNLAARQPFSYLPHIMQFVWFMSTRLYLSTEPISSLGAVGNGAAIKCVVDAINWSNCCLTPLCGKCESSRKPLRMTGLSRWQMERMRSDCLILGLVLEGQCAALSTCHSLQLCSNVSRWSSDPFLYRPQVK